MRRRRRRRAAHHHRGVADDLERHRLRQASPIAPSPRRASITSTCPTSCASRPRRSTSATDEALAAMGYKLDWGEPNARSARSPRSCARARAGMAPPIRAAAAPRSATGDGMTGVIGRADGDAAKIRERDERVPDAAGPEAKRDSEPKVNQRTRRRRHRTKRNRSAVIAGAVVGGGSLGFFARSRRRPPIRSREGSRSDGRGRAKPRRPEGSRRRCREDARRRAEGEARRRGEARGRRGAQTDARRQGRRGRPRSKADLEAVQAKLKALIDRSSGLGVDRAATRSTSQLVDRVLFKPATTSCTDRGKEVLDKVAAALKDSPTSRSGCRATPTTSRSSAPKVAERPLRRARSRGRSRPTSPRRCRRRAMSDRRTGSCRRRARSRSCTTCRTSRRSIRRGSPRSRSASTARSRRPNKAANRRIEIVLAARRLPRSSRVGRRARSQCPRRAGARRSATRSTSARALERARDAGRRALAREHEDRDRLEPARRASSRTTSSTPSLERVEQDRARAQRAGEPRQLDERARHRHDRVAARRQLESRAAGGGCDRARRRARRRAPARAPARPAA